MSIATSPGLIVDAISGAVLLALGAWVATRRPRTKVNAAFGGFAVAMGVGFVLVNVLTADDPLAGAADLAGGIALVLAGALLLYLGVHFPRPLTKDDRHMLLLPAGIGGVVGLVVSSSTLAGSQSVAFQIQSISIAFLFAAHVFVLALLPLRHAQTRGTSSGEGRHRQQLVLMAGALTLWPAINFGPATYVPGVTPPMAAIILAAMALIAALWFRALRRTPPAERSGPRVLVVLPLLVFGLGFVLTPLIPGTTARGEPAIFDSGLMGATRMLTVLVFAYAILRHQLFDIDLKVKWSIKQSTVAAVFIAVFFVVSEGAQQFFAETTLGPWLGILAAGALVFALAPLQRFAERVSDAAMPDVKPVDEMSDEERLAAYRRQVEIVWMDGRIGAKERMLLREARRQLGLEAAAADTVEAEVERAVAGGEG